MLNKFINMKSRKIIVFCTMFFNISGCTSNSEIKFNNASTQHSSIPSNLKGIYAVMPNNPISEAKYQALLSNPNIDGFYIQADWRDVEVNPKVFNWDILDSKITRIEKAGKKVTVAVLAGSSAPDWLWKKGAKYLETKVDANRQKNFCSEIKIPLPWDPIFLEEWNAFINSFGARYDKNPAISSVKITGVSYRTSEISLPRSTGKIKKSKQGLLCNLPDDVQNWRNHGYTSAKVIDAFSNITKTFVTAFPNKPLVIMTDDNSFPPIGAKGEFDPNSTSLSTTIFLKIGTELAGDRFIGQSNGLTAFKNSIGIKAFGDSGHAVGYQAAWYLSGHPDCHMSNGQKTKTKITNCSYDAATMQSVINQAKDGKAHYIELMPVDLLSPEFADVISSAHRYFNSF